MPKFSFMVMKSASIWVGCPLSVRPFHTGTPLYFARSSTCSCLKPRNSMPSNMLPSTSAVSRTVSFLPSWMSFLPRYSGCAPRSMHAVVNAARVRVDVFSNKSAMFLPAR